MTSWFSIVTPVTPNKFGSSMKSSGFSIKIWGIRWIACGLRLKSGGSNKNFGSPVKSFQFLVKSGDAKLWVSSKNWGVFDDVVVEVFNEKGFRPRQLLFPNSYPLYPVVYETLEIYAVYSEPEKDHAVKTWLQIPSSSPLNS